MSAYTCLILDDEPIARDILLHYVSQVPELQLVASLADPIEALAVLRSERIDLLLLDIQMPGLNGLQVLESLAQSPAVIFTTAHREYALEGFELAAIDYLLKPIALPRFLKAINRFLESKTISISVPRSDNPAHLFVRSDRRSVKVLLTDIIWVEGLKDYIRIHTPSQKWVVKSSLTGFAERLESKHFLRIHRSYIVARAKITQYDGEEVVLGAQTLPLGRTYKQAFLQIMSSDPK